MVCPGGIVALLDILNDKLKYYLSILKPSLFRSIIEHKIKNTLKNSWLLRVFFRGETYCSPIKQTLGLYGLSHNVYRASATARPAFNAAILASMIRSPFFKNICLIASSKAS